MVNIIPRQPSFAEEFARNLGAGFTKGVEKSQEAYADMASERAKQEQKMKLLSALLGGNLEESNQTGQKLQGQSTQSSSQINQREQDKPSKRSSSLSNQQILALNAIDPTFANIAQQQKSLSEKSDREERKMIQAEKESALKETLPLRTEFANKAKYARQGIENKKQALSLLQRGNIDNPLTVGIAEYLPGAFKGQLLSADTQLYKTGLFEEFGVLKSMFPGQIRVKEIELLEDKLATLDKTHEAKAKILENGILKLDRDIILGKAAREVEKENPNARISELEGLVAERAQPELEKLYNKIVEGYDKIYLEYAPAKSSYIDQDGHIYPNVPKSKLKQLFDEAKNEGLELRPY